MSTTSKHSAADRDRTLITQGEDLEPISVRIATAVKLTGIGRSTLYERSEEHTSELQSLMRISYAGCCLKKKSSSPGPRTATPAAPKAVPHRRAQVLYH